MTAPGCILRGCGRPHHARGYCRAHHARWQRHGDPRGEVPVAGRVRDGGSYWAARRRLVALRGRATEQRCGECGGPAALWSYDGSDPDERTEPGRALRYSLDPARYRPRCRSCQRRTLDCGRPAAVLPEPDVERAARLYRAGASARGIAALLAASRAAVLRALRAHGVAIRRPGRRR